MTIRERLIALICILIGTAIVVMRYGNTPVRSEITSGLVTAVGTATDKNLTNAPVLTVKVPDGREVAVLFPGDRPVPPIGASVTLNRNFLRFFGDDFSLAQ